MDLDEQAMVGDGLFSLAYFLRLLLVARSVFFHSWYCKGSFRYVAPPNHNSFVVDAILREKTSEETRENPQYHSCIT